MTMAHRFSLLMQSLLVWCLALYLAHRGVQGHVSSHTLSKDWKRFSTWQEQAPAYDDGVDWASLERDMAGPQQSPSSSAGRGSSSTSSSQRFRSWLMTHNARLAHELNRAEYLRRFPGGPKAAEYRQQYTRTRAEIYQEIKTNHGQAYQRMLADTRRRGRKYEDAYKALRAQKAANTISDADKERLDKHDSRKRESKRKYKQRKSEGY